MGRKRGPVVEHRKEKPSSKIGEHAAERPDRSEKDVRKRKGTKSGRGFHDPHSRG